MELERASEGGRDLGDSVILKRVEMRSRFCEIVNGTSGICHEWGFFGAVSVKIGFFGVIPHLGTDPALYSGVSENLTTEGERMSEYKTQSDIDRDELWDYLAETQTATEEELRLVTCINGHSLETLESVLFARTGYRSLEQIQGEE